jgi:hypothetical protein
MVARSTGRLMYIWPKQLMASVKIYGTNKSYLILDGSNKSDLFLDGNKSELITAWLVMSPIEKGENLNHYQP